MITLIENDISLEEYLTLREKVGWKKLTDKQAAHALANCLYKVKRSMRTDRSLVWDVSLETVPWSVIFRI